MIAVALDTGGEAAVRDWIRPADAAALPRELRDIMGWTEAQCAGCAPPTYPCLIDEKHIVAELYDMVNVPSAVWIDEGGRIVRPTEPAGTSDAFRTADRSTFRMPGEAAAAAPPRRAFYVSALRDWVHKGEASAHRLSDEEARRRLRRPDDERAALAAAHFRLGQYLHSQGRAAPARAHFQEAVRLRPESWCYRRQALELGEAGKASGPEFWAAVDALGTAPYYPPVNMEGMP